MKTPGQWKDGIPANLEAAAADAGVWLQFVDIKVSTGTWKMSDELKAKLRESRGILSGFLLLPGETEIPHPNDSAPAPIP